MITTALAILLQLGTTAQLTVNDGEEVTIPIAPAGTTVQLPDFVRVVTPAPDYSIKPLSPPRPVPANRGGASAAAAEPTDVRIFLVRAARLGAGEQPVTFVLADGRSVTARFVPGSARDESFYDLRWMRRSGGTARTRGGEQFLAAERALLLAMMRDEQVLGRKIVKQPIELRAYPELQITLVRAYESPDGVTGGVYLFTNRSDRTVVVNPTVLAVGTPNRALLTQMDHEELRACRDDDRPDPRGTGCTSVVRIVSRTEQTGVLAEAARGASMPYVLTPKDKDKR